MRAVGLCHSVQGTARDLARDLGVPAEEVDYVVAGINHLAFYLRLERDGEDLYPALRRVLDDGRLRRPTAFATSCSDTSATS